MKLGRLIAATILTVSVGVNAEVHTGKDVLTIHSPDSRPCTFFRLVGVSEADTVVANNSWFSVPLNHQGHDVIVSVLLAAYTSKNKVNVTTTGNNACGHAEVSGVSYYH